MFLAQIAAPTMPELPDGPSLDRVRGPVEIPTYEPWLIACMILLGVIALGLITWAIIALLCKQNNKRAQNTPANIALSEIQTAAALTADDDERFAVLTSHALRRYFEEGLGLAASGRTSEEFLRSLKGNTRFSSNTQVQLAQFLAHCDGIKFARKSATAEQRTILTNAATELIQQAETTKEIAQP